MLSMVKEIRFFVAASVFGLFLPVLELLRVQYLSGVDIYASLTPSPAIGADQRGGCAVRLWRSRLRRVELALVRGFYTLYLRKLTYLLHDHVCVSCL